MKKLFTLFALTLCLTNLKAQFVTIPDINFRLWLLANVPTAMTGNQMDTSNWAVTTRSAITVDNLNIIDLTGVQYFHSLLQLSCSNNPLTNLPILPNSLTHLFCNSNSLYNIFTLPNNLEYLSCSYNLLTNLPSLPNSLKQLNCDANQLINLPVLPNSLQFLNCISNQLTSIPILPNTLLQLHCYQNQLTSLPTLPNSLLNLACDHNQLTNLPVLPDSLYGLSCGANQLTNLPPFPTKLTHLSCGGNQITNLPALPNSIIFLWCNNNQLSNLPLLPNSITSLNCSYNNISCFAPFNPIGQIIIKNNPINCLPNYVPAMDAGTLNYPLCTIGNINGCQDSKGIVGFTYKDNNTNCTKNAGDLGLKNIPIQIYDNTGNLLSQTYSSINGVYQFLQTANTYSVAIDTQGLPFISNCFYPGLDSTVTVTTLDTNINFALICKSGFDLGIQSIYTNGIIFPGQAHVLNVNAGDITHWYNLNCAAGISGKLSFSVNGPITYIGPAVGALAPSIAGNVYTFNIIDFGTINNSTDFKLVFKTDTSAQAGDVICVNATVTPITGDNNQSNNTYTHCYNVSNSYDPNIKEVYPVNVQPGFNDWLTYTIHFQNTGTAPAFNIRLTDQMDNMLDLETFQVINYSHSNLVDLTGNTLNVRFPNIQLPDSTSNSVGSIGFIQYRIKPQSNLPAGTKIENTAYIYFDYNSPIVTNTTINEFITDVSVIEIKNEFIVKLYPNPSNGSFTIEINNLGAEPQRYYTENKHLSQVKNAKENSGQSFEELNLKRLNTKEKQLLEVFDMTGNLVLSQSIENGKVTIDGNHLTAGIYNISIKGNNSVVNKKLVIVK